MDSTPPNPANWVEQVSTRSGNTWGFNWIGRQTANFPKGESRLGLAPYESFDRFLGMTSPSHEDVVPGVDASEIHAALFQQLIRGHGQMALMLLGRLENPHTQRCEEPDPIGAKVFIDQLEMLALKTQGNLNETELDLLKQTLSTTMLAFVEVNQAGGVAV